MDAVVDRKFPDDLDYASILSKVIGNKLSNGSISDLYSRSRMNFTADNIQTQTPKFVDLGLSTINILDESSGLSTPATRIRRPRDGAHWSALNNVFDKANVVGTSKAKLDN